MIDLQPVRDAIAETGDIAPGNPFGIGKPSPRSSDADQLKIAQKLLAEWEARAKTAEAENAKLKERARFMRSVLTPEDAAVPSYYEAFLEAVLEPHCDPNDTLFRYVQLLVETSQLREMIGPLVGVVEKTEACPGIGVRLKDCDPQTFTIYHNGARSQIQALVALLKPRDSAGSPVETEG